MAKIPPIPPMQEGVKIKISYPEMPDFKEEKPEPQPLRDNESVVMDQKNNAKVSSQSSSSSEPSDLGVFSNQEYINKKSNKMGALISHRSSDEDSYQDLLDDLLQLPEPVKKKKRATTTFRKQVDEQKRKKRVDAMADYELSDSSSPAQSEKNRSRSPSQDALERPCTAPICEHITRESEEHIEE